MCGVPSSTARFSSVAWGSGERVMKVGDGERLRGLEGGEKLSCS
jgi:hypothetical protein